MSSGAPTDDRWTIQRMIQWATNHFNSKGIESSRLDTELLLSHVLKCRRLDLYLKFDQPLQDTELADFKKLVIRRIQREPVAYILGKQEFYGRNFSVGKGVLIPRPETELLIDEALAFLKTTSNEKPQVLDIGSGSGAIGVTMACENPSVTVTSLDVSSEAIQITTLNARDLGVSERIQIKEQSFSGWTTETQFDLVVANPPYIGLSQKSTLMKEVVHYEPEIALFGGEEGHELIREWLPQMAKLLKPEGLLLCEIGYDQREKVKDLAEKLNCFKSIQVILDHSSHPRLLRAQKKEESHG